MAKRHGICNHQLNSRAEKGFQACNSFANMHSLNVLGTVFWSLPLPSHFGSDWKQHKQRQMEQGTRGGKVMLTASNLSPTAGCSVHAATNYNKVKVAKRSNIYIYNIWHNYKLSNWFFSIKYKLFSARPIISESN